MGEHADDLIDQFIFGRHGHFGQHRRKKPSPKCQVCGKPGLMWQEVEGKWRLYESTGVEHSCRKASSDEFEVLP